jgi:maleate isomerase
MEQESPGRVIGIVAPATNIMVQPEMDGLRPPGVINAHARIPNPDQRVAADADTLAVRAAMVAGLEAALDTLAPVRPEHLVLGVMVENFVGGGEAGAALVARCGARLGCGVTDYSTAILTALSALFGRPARIGLLTPFMPVGDAAARALFEAAGHEVVRLVGLKAPGPVAIARVPRARIASAIRELDGPEVEAIIQVGTNLPFAELAREAEGALGKPVLASNAVSYWHALGAMGLHAPRPALGRLFASSVTGGNAA